MLAWVGVPGLRRKGAAAVAHPWLRGSIGRTEHPWSPWDINYKAILSYCCLLLSFFGTETNNKQSNNKLKCVDKLDNMQGARCKETLLAREMLVLQILRETYSACLAEKSEIRTRALP